jgi:hypothetical protein
VQFNRFYFRRYANGVTALVGSLVNGWAWSVWISALLLSLAGCTTYAGIAEFEGYRKAFATNYATGSAILDQLAVKERSLFLRLHPPGNTQFDPDLAVYYLDIGDPPGTAAFRKSLDLVRTYNDLLYGLATGAPAAELSAKVQTLRASAVAAENETRSALSAITRGRGGAASVLSPLVASLGVADELIQVALRSRSREDFRRFVLEYHDDVIVVLQALRSGNSIIFPILTRDATSSIEGVDTAKVEGYRRLLADWVIGIDATINSLAAVRDAAVRQPTLSVSTGSLTTFVVELEMAAASARKHLAELGAN